MYHALWLVEQLRTAGLECYCPLMMQAGTSGDDVLDHLEGDDELEPAQVLVVLQTAAFYQDEQCLKEVRSAIEGGATIIPLRIEDVPDKRQQWPVSGVDGDARKKSSHSSRRRKVQLPAPTARYPAPCIQPHAW